MKLVDYFFLLFLLVGSLDPTGFYTSYLKVILFGALVLFGFFTVLSKHIVITKNNQLTLILFVLIPIYGLLISGLTQNTIDEKYALSHFESMLFVFLFIFLVTRDIKLIFKLYWLNGIVISLLTIGLFSYSQVSHDQFVVIYEFMQEGNSFMMAHEREFLGVSVEGLYFRCGPLIIFSLLYTLYFYKGKFKWPLALGMVASLVMAGSRTPALVALLIFFIYLYDIAKSSSKTWYKSVINWIIGLASVSFIFGLFYLTFQLATEQGVGSNDLKYANFNSYIDDIFTGLHCIFGAGLGSTFWAAGNREMLSYTELSFMDIYRIYGLIIGSVFVWLLLRPALSIRGFLKRHIEYKRFYLGYFLFLVLAGTNPILIGSIGFSGLTLAMAVNNSIKLKKI